MKKMTYSKWLSAPMYILRDPNNPPPKDADTKKMSDEECQRFIDKYYVVNPDIYWEPPKYTREELKGKSREELLEIYDEIGLPTLFGIYYNLVDLDLLIDAIAEGDADVLYRNLPEGALV